jgi:hypothetical protein
VTCSTRPGRIGPLIGQWLLKYAREQSDFDCRLLMPMVEWVMVPMAWNQIDDSKVFHSNELIGSSAPDLLAELEKWAKGLKAMR